MGLEPLPSRTVVGALPTEPTVGGLIVKALKICRLWYEISRGEAVASYATRLLSMRKEAFAYRPELLTASVEPSPISPGRGDVCLLGKITNFTLVQ